MTMVLLLMCCSVVVTSLTAMTSAWNTEIRQCNIIVIFQA